MKSLGDFAMLQTRNVFRKNPLSIETKITNRKQRRLIEKLERRGQAIKIGNTQFMKQ